MDLALHVAHACIYGLSVNVILEVIKLYVLGV